MTAEAKTFDYYAVSKPSGFVCHVFATSKQHALKIARDTGLSIGREARASLIGRAGYFSALSRVFKTNIQ